MKRSAARADSDMAKRLKAIQVKAAILTLADRMAAARAQMAVSAHGGDWAEYERMDRVERRLRKCIERLLGSARMAYNAEVHR